MRPYVPEELPLDPGHWSGLIGLVGQANRALARYDGMLESVINPAILLSPLTTQEAVLSSKIEGTQATLDEVLEHDAGQTFDEDKTRDIQEIVNYRKVLTYAAESLKDRPITLGMLREMHTTLMDSVRGQTKSPGEFRSDQNWIGPPRCAIENASFVPPAPLQLLDHLEAWERYVAGDDADILIQTAIVHAQFELIHPFKDGNGRIGRLLIPLFLYSKSCLTAPMFYLSAYLESNREEYYARLQALSQKRAWGEWVAFFLKGITDQAKENANKVRAAQTLYDEMKERIRDITHSQFSIQILDAIFARPIFQSSDIAQRTGMPRQTILPLLRQLRDAGVLTTLQEARGNRPARLAFPALLNIAEGRRIL